MRNAVSDCSCSKGHNYDDRGLGDNTEEKTHKDTREVRRYW